MAKYANTVLWRHQIVYILMHRLNRIPRKCKWLHFHAHSVMLSSRFIPCSENDRHHTEEEIQACVINILQKPQSCRCRSRFFGFIQVSPFSCCLPKNLRVDPNREASGGRHSWKFFFPLPFKYFLLHFCFLTWYPLCRWGRFFLELCRILGTWTIAIVLSSFHCQETKPYAALEKFKGSISQWGPDAVRCLASDRTGPSDRTYSVFKWSAKDTLCLKFIPAQDCEHSVQ